MAQAYKIGGKMQIWMVPFLLTMLLGGGFTVVSLGMVTVHASNANDVMKLALEVGSTLAMIALAFAIYANFKFEGSMQTIFSGFAVGILDVFASFWLSNSKGRDVRPGERGLLPHLAVVTSLIVGAVVLGSVLHISSPIAADAAMTR